MLAALEETDDREEHATVPCRLLTARTTLPRYAPRQLHPAPRQLHPDDDLRLPASRHPAATTCGPITAWVMRGACAGQPGRSLQARAQNHARIAAPLHRLLRLGHRGGVASGACHAPGGEHWWTSGVRPFARLVSLKIVPLEISRRWKRDVNLPRCERESHGGMVPAATPASSSV